MSVKIILYFSIVLWNGIVFTSYGIDKNKARKGLWRISERLLLLESIFFGGLGAFLAGHLFHHKTRKWYFQLVWYLGIVMTCVLMYLIWRI
ncbi:DUF1294 domain-containing protein [Streptococcus sp. FT1-55]|uniref:DUF1294 domain-containing protein n=1 Tax=Streptococcus sp. FT1-55 TaxID=3409805 RepID=UPI003BF5454B